MERLAKVIIVVIIMLFIYLNAPLQTIRHATPRNVVPDLNREFKSYTQFLENLQIIFSDACHVQDWTQNQYCFLWGMW